MELEYQLQVMERRSGGVSMLRLKKLFEDQEMALSAGLPKRSMSMMRLRRQDSNNKAWERPIRGPSMMRLKRFPMTITKDLQEQYFCLQYPHLC